MIKKILFLSKAHFSYKRLVVKYLQTKLLGQNIKVCAYKHLKKKHLKNVSLIGEMEAQIRLNETVKIFLTEIEFVSKQKQLNLFDF